MPLVQADCKQSLPIIAHKNLIFTSSRPWIFLEFEPLITKSYRTMWYGNNLSCNSFQVHIRRKKIIISSFSYLRRQIFITSRRHYRRFALHFFCHAVKAIGFSSIGVCVVYDSYHLTSHSTIAVFRLSPFTAVVLSCVSSQ